MGETTTCAIIGGIPAGMVLGLLLARVQVTPARRLPARLSWRHGATDDDAATRRAWAVGSFAACPYSEVRTATLHSNGRAVTYIDFERLHQPYPYVAMWCRNGLLEPAGGVN